MTSALIGVSKLEQLEDNAAVVEHLDFTQTELQQIEEILK